jgi:hypothetical protein
MQDSQSLPISRPVSAGQAARLPISRLPIKPLASSPLSLTPLNVVDEEVIGQSILSPLPIKGSVRRNFEDSEEFVSEVDLSSSMKAKNEFMEIIGNNLYKNSFSKSSKRPKTTGLAF